VDDDLLLGGGELYGAIARRAVDHLPEQFFRHIELLAATRAGDCGVTHLSFFLKQNAWLSVFQRPLAAFGNT